MKSLNVYIFRVSGSTLLALLASCPGDLLAPHKNSLAPGKRTRVLSRSAPELLAFCLQVGDTAGVLRKPDGALHFFFNGRDLGVAARGVPPGVYGVVDLYGRSAQATITSYASDVRPAIEVEVTAATGTWAQVGFGKRASYGILIMWR